MTSTIGNFDTILLDTPEDVEVTSHWAYITEHINPVPDVIGGTILLKPAPIKSLLLQAYKYTDVSGDFCYKVRVSADMHGWLRGNIGNMHWVAAFTSVYKMYTRKK